MVQGPGYLARIGICSVCAGPAKQVPCSILEKDVETTI